jgi:hypothetical protein
MNSLTELIRDLDPRVANPYLKFHGWELASQGEMGDRWRLKTNGRIRNIAVPRLIADEPDRVDMLRTVLLTLAEIEERDPIAVALDLDSAANDTLEFRIVGAAFQRGEIPLPSAPDLTSGALEAMQSAARAEVSRRPYYGQGQIPAPVRSFLDHAKLIGTKKGSVILRVRPPAPPVVPQESFEGLSKMPSYERRVIRRLVEGIRAAKTAAHRDPAALTVDALDEDVDEGLSANLCQALSKLSGGETNAGESLSIRVRWSLAEPTDDPSTEVTVDRQELHRLVEVAEILRGIEPQPDATITGPVTQLKRDQGESEGRISLAAEIDGKVRTVHIAVSIEDYEKAAKAHLADKEVEAIGTLERAGRSRELTSLQSLESL